jgi:hypothetical protein
LGAARITDNTMWWEWNARVVRGVRKKAGLNMRARIVIAVQVKHEDNFARLLLVVKEATSFCHAFAIKSESSAEARRTSVLSKCHFTSLVQVPQHLERKVRSSR